MKYVLLKNPRAISLKCITLLICCLILNACGQTGRLYLPNKNITQEDVTDRT
jgi:predicted small lipoprotein YifL